MNFFKNTSREYHYKNEKRNIETCDIPSITYVIYNDHNIVGEQIMKNKAGEEASELYQKKSYQRYSPTLFWWQSFPAHPENKCAQYDLTIY